MAKMKPPKLDEPAYIAEDLRPLAVPLDSLTPDPANVRLHNARNLQAIKGSLAKFGQQVPLVVNGKGIIIKGNGTYAAAQALGWTRIAARVTDLNELDQTGFAIADNRTAELAEWDFEGLAATIKTLQEQQIDLTQFGWQPHELEPLLAAEWQPPEIAALPARAATEEGHAVRFTPGQFALLERLAVRIRDETGQPSLSLAECIETVCAKLLHDNR